MESRLGNPEGKGLPEQERPSRFTLKNGQVTLADYDKAPPFTSFLPGLSGVRGIPLWVFYCNRGQGVSSMGVHHKGNALMEFHPANIAYEKTALEGFRTFLRAGGRFYEPFSPLERQAQRSMTILPNGLAVEETHEALGVRVRAQYRTLPGAPIGALVRSVTIENLSDREQAIQALDGLPRIIPYGLGLKQFQEMGNLYKSWAQVETLPEGAALYLLRSSTEDSAKVREATGAYFFHSVLGGKALPVVYDPATVFGEESAQLLPLAFLEGGLEGVLAQEPCGLNRIACGFAAVELHLTPGQEATLDTYVGFTPTAGLLREQLPLFSSPEYGERKRREADQLAERMLADVATKTADPMLDAYIGQCYLDNFLRGGYPYVMGGDKVVHLFSRKHGDPERDYNWFAIAGEYYSQGNGNFRDVCQNRRLDVRMNPAVGDYNVWSFFSLVQADGNNPLEIRPATFRLQDGEKAKALLAEHLRDEEGHVAALLAQEFTPGMVAGAIAAHGIEVTGSEEALVEGLLALSEQRIQAGFGEGYWSDHFGYLLDLVEDYLAVYPDQKDMLLCGREDYGFFHSGAVVRPRSETAQLTDKGVRRYDALDTSRLVKDTRWLKDRTGRDVTTNLLGKLLVLAATKTALLDPEGLGLSMDGGRPGWNDAMNGLPGLFGSGMAETMELKRILDFLLALEQGRTRVPAELARLMRGLKEALAAETAHERWDRANTLLEEYRAALAVEASGDMTLLDMADIRPCLEAYRQQVQEGIRRALELGQGLMPTYLCYHAQECHLLLDGEGRQRLSPSGLPLVKVTAFRLELAPAFLEGPARYLAGLDPERDGDAAERTVEAVAQSQLYDRELGMYLTSVPLEEMSMEYGRIRAFTPGWLERESVFLHMEYKYLLGMLKAGRYEDFYRAARRALIPFLSPDAYGRSTLENSSFLASSRNPDPRVRGRGFVSRLSGSTAEMLSLWQRMFVGEGGFELREGALGFRIAPRLAGWLFDSQGEAGFTLLSHCRVTYHNPSRKDTYGEEGARIKRITYGLGGAERALEGDVLPDGLALRQGEIPSVHLWLE